MACTNMMGKTNSTRQTAETQSTSCGRLSRRGGFTLIEVVMAGMLSAIIAMVAMGFFYTMAQADRSSKTRSQVMVDMSRTHRALQRTFRTMLLDTSAPRPGETRAARIALVEGGLGPRLELTLTRPPIFGVIDGQPMTAATQNSSAIGALELRRPMITRADGTRLADETQLELWWTPYSVETRQAELDANNTAKGIRIAGGIKSLDMRFAKTNDNKLLERVKTAEVSGWDQVPAYVEANIEMIDGQKASWLFEVAAQGGAAPTPTGGGGGVASADADIPRDVSDRLNEAAGRPPTTTDTASATNANSNPDSAAAAASEAQRLREALALAYRLIAQLTGGGGGGDE